MKIFQGGVSKLTFLILLIFLPFTSFAQITTGGASICNPDKEICNPIPSVSSIPELIRIILEAVLKIGIPIIALAIIYSGFLFVAAQGNDEKLTTAKRALMYTLIGAAILLGSWAIAKLISETVLEISSNYLFLIS